MKVSSTSSAVADSGRFTVFDMAPDRNGCTAAIIRRWPSTEIGLSPSEVANTSR